jgi:GNAT superfamily N-acetyltransferase
MLIRSKTADDQPRVESVLAELWGSCVVVHGTVFDASALPALIAGDFAGLLTYATKPPSAEIVTLNALTPWRGVGSALIAALVAQLVPQGVREIRVTMTNDNIDALRFYQRRGFRIATIRPGGVDEARRVKPTIPRIGNYGIPRQDEIELVRLLI